MQPSATQLNALGIKVRDFAYENTLPAIVPVPRVPRQVQPSSKRSQRDWDDHLPAKKTRSLERTPTEPLQEPVVQHTRTLERITVCSIIIPPHTPGNSLGFVVHVDDTSTSQMPSRPTLYTSFTFPATQSAPPSQLEADPRAKRRAGTSPHRYQLRQRPTPCSQPKSTAKSPPSRPHRMR